MSGRIFRCQADGNLLLEKHIATGECFGHRLTLAYHGGLLDWLKVRYWKLTGQLK